MNTTPQRVTSLLREICIPELSAREARGSFVSALRRVAGLKSGRTQQVDTTLKELSKSDDFPWLVGAAYWSLRQKENLLPTGTIFTPTKLARQVIDRLLPGVRVVDLGAGTGMLTLAAAKRGFRVTAIEEDLEMTIVLDCLARILCLRDRIDLQVGDALAYRCAVSQQIMANPPYTRHHSIPSEKKRALAELASSLGVKLPLTAGYYAYFMVYAWSAQWSKREVLLLPTNWLDTRYGDNLRDILIKRGLKEIAIVRGADGNPVFENTLTTACLVTTQPSQSREPRSQVKSKIWVVEVEKASSKHQGDPTLRLVAKIKETLQSNSQNALPSGNALGDIFHIKRGIATGANAFFVLSKSSAEELGIPDSELRPILRSLTNRILPAERKYLWVPGEHPKTASLRRVEEGEGLGIDERYLCSHREPWWRVDTPEPPSYFMSYMGRNKPIIRTNRRGLLNLNNIHGLYLREGVSSKNSKRVVSWLRSRGGIAAMLKCARRYEGGFWKIEPGDAERIRLPEHLL